MVKTEREQSQLGVFKGEGAAGLIFIPCNEAGSKLFNVKLLGHPHGGGGPQSRRFAGRYC